MKEILTASIDIGTTTISALVLDILGERVITSYNIPNDATVKSENEWEHIQDARKIAKRAELLIRKIYEEHPKILSLGFTGQMHGIVYLDSKGECVSPLYTWQDGRGDIIAEDGCSYAESLTRLTGYPMASGYGLTTHYYNMKNGLVPRDAVSLCSIMDYLVMKYAHLTKPLIHPSVAASFGLFDVKQGCFDTLALSRAGIDIALPEIVGDRVVGVYNKTQITPAIGDNQASVFGSVAEEESSVLVNYGTGAQISFVCGDSELNTELEVRPYIGGKTLICGSALCGGSAYGVLEGFFRGYAQALGIEGSQYKVMDKLCERAYNEGIEPLEFSTLFKGTRTDPTLRGGIYGISDSNLTPEAMILGLVYGMARELYELYGKSGAGDRRLLVASGNGVQKNKVLQRVLCELFDMELMLTENREEAAMGAAMYALYCLEPSNDILKDVKGCIAYKK